MHITNWPAFIERLRHITAPFPLPMTETIINEFGHNPFLILISCLLSLRARDIVTIHVCRNLFLHSSRPEQFCAMPIEELEQTIYKTGFYKNKARTLQAVSAHLLAHHNGQVPTSEDELLALPGVGQKTASLVLGMAFNVPAICVDTHVHRISNLWGLVHTRSADETEKALKLVVPQEYWIEWNKLLVMLGQNMRDRDIALILLPSTDSA